MARRNEHTKDQLKFLALEAATKIIKSEGISELSTRKIAKDIGYAAGTLYNIFKDVDDIILHINSQTMLEIMEMFISKKEERTPHNLEILISDYLNYIQKNYEIWSCLFEYKQKKDGNLPEWYTENLNFIISTIEKYISSRFLDAEERTYNAELIWNSVNGICFVGMTSASEGTNFRKLNDQCLSVVRNCLK